MSVDIAVLAIKMVCVAVCLYYLWWSVVSLLMLYNDTTRAQKHFEEMQRMVSGQYVDVIDNITLNDLWGDGRLPRNTKYAQDAHGLKYIPQTFSGAPPRYADKDSYSASKFQSIVNSCQNGTQLSLRESLGADADSYQSSDAGLTCSSDTGT
jgi:hypothetical protein